MHAEDDVYDLAIIGAGPVGLTAANLAVVHGLRVIVVEKEARPYALPRAIHFNGDVLRVFQSAGLTDMIRPQIGVQRGTTIYGADGALNMRLNFPEDDSTGWHRQYCFYQPVLEGTLRDNLIGRPGARLDYSCEAVQLSDDGGGVDIQLSSREGERTVRVSHVVACDGARSPARNALGIEMEDLGGSENWVVVDTFVDGVIDLPSDRTVIRSDPRQPAVYVPGPGPHRRFEWQIAPGADVAAAASDENIVRVIDGWIDSARVEIVRHATYTFNARIARRWQVGRIFLAGDAAHQTPPFLGQGMGHGVRDVANLIWKLAACRRGADKALLDSYEPERKPHVETVIRRSLEVGRGMGIRDPQAAAERDRVMRNAGPVDRIDTDKTMPPLSVGLVGRGSSAGTAFPQPRVGVAGHMKRLDDVIGLRSGFLFRSDPGEAVRRLLYGHDALCGIALDGDEVSPAILLHDGDRVRDWLDRAGSDFCVTRPDRYIYAHGTMEEAEQMLKAYIACIA